LYGYGQVAEEERKRTKDSRIFAKIRVATRSERKLLGAHPRRNRTKPLPLVTPNTLDGAVSSR